MVGNPSRRGITPRINVPAPPGLGLNQKPILEKRKTVTETSTEETAKQKRPLAENGTAGGGEGDKEIKMEMDWAHPQKTNQHHTPGPHKESPGKQKEGTWKLKLARQAKTGNSLRDWHTTRRTGGQLLMAYMPLAGR